ncbi:MAG: hypothetical protein IPN59_13710 [Holophaga sp.]|nr:hypothetical protein [Holophaga sp.]
MTACAPAAPDLANLAAAEATQIVQQAQATALIQNARATANVLLTPSVLAPQATPIPTVILVEAASETAQPVEATNPAAPTEEISHTVKLLKQASAPTTTCSVSNSWRRSPPFSAGSKAACI